MTANRIEHMLFANRKKWGENLCFTHCRHLRFFSLYFLPFLSVFFTMPTEKRLSLKDKGAIVALRGEGYIYHEISSKLSLSNFEKRAEKNCAKGVGPHHSRVPCVTLRRMQAVVDAQGGHTKY